MVRHRFYGKVVFVVFCLVVLVYTRSYGEPQTTPPTADLPEVGSRLINRVIPSKDKDLFVVLKNGLTVLIRESHASDVVSCRIMVKTGSVFEGEDTGAGLSHYLEHVVSGGTTAKFTEAEIKEKLRAIGGATNAYTSYDDTVYFIDTISVHYGEALELLVSYVTQCQFNEMEYAREKKVILQEFQMGENNPSRQLWQSFMETAYRRHPVRYPIIGQREVFAGIDKKRLSSYYDRCYVPGNMVLVVVGNVDKEDALNVILDLVKGVKRAKNPFPVLPTEPRQLSSRNVEKSLPMAKLTKALLGFRTIKLSEPDLYPLDVLAVIMGDGRTSRLYRTVRDKKRLVLSVSASSWTPYFVEGQFLVSMNLSYDDLPKAVDAVWDEVSDVKENLVDKETLKRAKNKVVAGHIFGLESVQSQAAQLASDWVAAGDPYFSEKYVARVKEVTCEDIKKVAKKYLTKERMTLAVIKPHSSVVKQADSKKVKPLNTRVEKRILSNGMTLLLKKSTQAPIVSFKYFVKSGLRFEPIGKSGLSHFMAALLTKGTESRDKYEIARTLEDVGGSVSASSGHNTVTVSVSVLKEDFDIGLDILSDVILHPSFPEDEIQKQREDTLLGIKRLDEQWTTEVARLFKRHYYREHPYRNDVLGKVDTVASFSKEDITGFYESIMMPNNAVLAVFGDISPDLVTAKLEGAFREFEKGMLEQPIIEAETQNIEEDESFVTFNEKTSAAILVGYNGLSLGHADCPVVNVIDSIVSGIGYPGGWLHDALRGGEKSLVYYVHAYPAFGIDGGYFGIMTQTTPDNYDEVLQIVLDKITLLLQDKVDAKTLQQAKDVCITMHEIGLQTVAAQAAGAALNEILGLGYDYEKKYPELINNVSASDVLRVAKELFSHHLVVSTKPSD